jgi:hypothetical protein
MSAIIRADSIQALRPNETDVLAALIRAGTGMIPGWGGVVSELVLAALPGQRLDRLVRYVELLTHRLSDVECGTEACLERLRTADGLFLVEEGLVQAARATPDERIQRIARIVADGISSARLDADRTLKRRFCFSRTIVSQKIVERSVRAV